MNKQISPVTLRRTVLSLRAMANHIERGGADPRSARTKRDHITALHIAMLLTNPEETHAVIPAGGQPRALSETDSLTPEQIATLRSARSGRGRSGRKLASLGLAPQAASTSK